jgi:hypothetical protein
MMLREHETDAVELRVTLSQLKTIYLGLFRQLHEGGIDAMEALDEGDMLQTIQSYLQCRAREAGVDGTNHAEWDAFLGVKDSPSCAARFAKLKDSEGGSARHE